MVTVTELEEELPQEISNHPDRQGHNKLNLVTDTKTLSCQGCIENGMGARYRLELGGKSYDYHVCCAIVPATHLMSGDLKFFLEPPKRNDNKGNLFEACGKAVNHFVYHCSDDSGGIRYYHPCCALTSCKCRPMPTNTN